MGIVFVLCVILVMGIKTPISLFVFCQSTYPIFGVTLWCKITLNEIFAILVFGETTTSLWKGWSGHLTNLQFCRVFEVKRPTAGAIAVPYWVLSQNKYDMRVKKYPPPPPLSSPGRKLVDRVAFFPLGGMLVCKQLSVLVFIIATDSKTGCSVTCFFGFL